MRVRLIHPRLLEAEEHGNKTVYFVPDQMIGHLHGVNPSASGRTTATIIWNQGIEATKDAGDEEWESQTVEDIDDEDCPVNQFVYDPM
jgi:hypothetical protein